MCSKPFPTKEAETNAISRSARLGPMSLFKKRILLPTNLSLSLTTQLVKEYSLPRSINQNQLGASP